MKVFAGRLHSFCSRHRVFRSAVASCASTSFGLTGRSPATSPKNFSTVVEKLKHGPSLRDFMQETKWKEDKTAQEVEELGYLTKDALAAIGRGRRVFIETYG